MTTLMHVTNPKCSIIIRSYNEGMHIGKLLFGLTQQDHSNFEIILVDSGSTDDTVAIAQTYGVKVVHINKESFSFGRALNIGCQAAQGDILVFVSAHVYPLYRTWLSKLVAPFDHERVILSYGRQTGNHVNKYSEERIFAKWFPEHSVFPQQHHFCNNANCAIRKSAWEAQPYDETLTGLEDIAWAKEAQRRGGQIAYVSEAPIVHVHDETFERIRNRYRREAMAMRMIQPQMRFSLLDFVTLFVSNSFSDWAFAIKDRSFFKEAASIFLFRFNQFYGTWQGHRGHCEVTATLRDRFYFPQSRNERKKSASSQPSEEIINYEPLESEKDVIPFAPKAAKRHQTIK